MALFKKSEDAKLVMCVFPNQKEIIIVDTRKTGGNIVVLPIHHMFDEHVYKQLESVILRRLSADYSTFKDIMDIPEIIQMLIQKASISRVFDIMEVDDSIQNSSSSIGLMMFTGDILKILEKDSKRIHVIVNDLFGNQLNDNVKLELKDHLTSRVAIESRIENRNYKTRMKKIIFGDDDESFKTIWKSGD